MSKNENLNNGIVEEVLAAPDTRSKEQKAEDNLQADQLSVLRDLVWEFFNNVIMKSDLRMSAIESLPQYVTGAVKITQGRSKLWADANKAQEEYYKTSIKDLELYEDIKGDEEQD